MKDALAMAASLAMGSVLLDAVRRRDTQEAEAISTGEEMCN